MKHLKMLILLAGTILFNACSGNTDPDDITPSGPTEPFTLTADKSSIESDGKDVVKFTITDANGLILTDKQHIGQTSFCVNETNEWYSGLVLSNPNEFSSITDGTFTISAMYEGKYCENTVSIKSQNRKKYEVFHKNVAIYRLTGTWCGYCPSMTEALKNVNDFTKEHSVIFQFHNADEFAIPYSSSQDLAGALLSRFGTSDSGLPFCVYSLYEGSGDRKISDIQNFVKKQLYENPAVTGIKATADYSNNILTIQASVKATKAGKYDLGTAILKDGCIPTSSSSTEAVYNDVVISISGNYFAMSADSFNLNANEEKTFTKTFKMNDLNNCRIALFTLAESGNKTLIDNVTVLKAGENIDYIYN